MSVPYDIEERLEDSFVAYLLSAVSQTTQMAIFPAFSTEIIQYPCAVIKANHGLKLDPNGAWSTSRRMEVEIAVITEAANQIDGTGKVVTTARQLNRNARNAIMTALAIEDTDAGPSDLSTVVQADATDMPKGLAAYLVYQKIEGIWIKLAQVQDVDRSVESDKRCLISMISVAVIAQPVQIGGY